MHACCKVYALGVFIRMLQVFHLDVAQVDLDVAYIWNDCTNVLSLWDFCKRFRRMLKVFQLFRTYVASVSFKCCKSRLVSHMLQWDSLTTAACYSSWGATVGSPCRRLSPADASVTRIHRRGRWLEPTWFPTCGHDIQGGKQRGQRNRPPQVTRALRSVTREQTCSSASIFFFCCGFDQTGGRRYRSRLRGSCIPTRPGLDVPLAARKILPFVICLHICLSIVLKKFKIHNNVRAQTYKPFALENRP
jgi:hypothetical protein